jgi:hypothetical protein
MALAIVFCLFIPSVVRSLNVTIGSVVLIGVLSYEFSLLLSSEIPSYRRWATGYLVFSGFNYVLIGLMGVGGFGLITSNAWYHMISPGPALTVLGGLLRPSSFDIYELNYWICPESEFGQELVSLFSILGGAIGMAAAFAMGRKRKIGFHTWGALLIISALGSLCYAVADCGKWGAPQYVGPHDYTQTTISVAFATSYAVAYAVAKTRVTICDH